VKIGTFVFVDADCACVHHRLPPKGCVQDHLTALNFGLATDNIFEIVQDRDLAAMEDY